MTLKFAKIESFTKNDRSGNPDHDFDTILVDTPFGQIQITVSSEGFAIYHDAEGADAIPIYEV